MVFGKIFLHLPQTHPVLNSRTLLSVLFLLCSGVAFAQKTIVSGRITEKSTGEPLPFVKVYFKNTKFATSTNDDGFYRIETIFPVDTIKAEMMGYISQEFKVQKDKVQEINFELKDSEASLNEVVVRPPKEDPAILLFKQIQKNKKANNREKLASYAYSMYNKIEFDLNNINDEFTERRVFKPVRFIFDHIDTTEEKRFLPVFLSETISRYHYKRNPKNTKEYIEASQVSGIDNQSVSQFLGDFYQNVNVYDNNIDVFSKSFISPISEFGRLYYDYYLNDSAFIDNNWCYQVLFFSKRKQEPTFTGNFWVHDTTFAIRIMEAEITREANINFVNSLRVRQVYEQVQPEVWMLTRDELFADIYVTNKTMGFYGRKTALYRDFVIDSIADPKVFSGPENVIVRSGAQDKSREWWDSTRYEPLSENERMIYVMIDSLGEVPQVKTYVDIVSMLISGYKVWGPVEIGPYSSMYSFNTVEGHRFRIGGRTSNAFSKRFELSGYLAYGLRDQQFKYRGGYRWMISKKPRLELGMYYTYQLEQLGRSANAFREDFALSTALMRVPNDKLTLIEEYKGYLNREWFSGFNSQIMFRRRYMEPRGVLEYLRTDLNGNNVSVPSVLTSEFIFYTRFAYKERFLEGEFDRISTGTRWPVFTFQYILGLKNFWGGQYNYRKAVMNIGQWFPIGIWGWTRYSVEAGTLWGSLPFPLLFIHSGNQSYYLDEKAFNSMNFFEFVSDKYVQCMVTHHFDGLFFNKVPLFRKLKWREVAHFNAVWGSLSNAHLQEMQLMPIMNSLERIPFMELGVGVENIFKFLRVDVLWRLTYRNNPDVSIFGVRFMADVKF